ncbi:hypothetical protein ACT7DC_01625 [Bacillus cereus]
MEALALGDTISAEIVISDTCASTTIDTGIIATVTGPSSSTNCCAFATGNFLVNQCELLSVRITMVSSVGNTALENVTSI